jgi:four helix bundle protein
MQIFELSRKWPSEEKFSLTDQIRRSSRSVCANIAAAWRKRRYEAAFVSKLSDSDEEAAETEVHLDFALQCGYMSPENHATLRDHYDHICGQLRKMMNDAPSWCGTGCELRELPVDYFVGTLPSRESDRSVESKEPQGVRYKPKGFNAPRSRRPAAAEEP